MTFDAFREPLDPNDQKDYTLAVQCNAGESLTSANVAFVGADGDSAPTGVTPAVVESSFGVVSGSTWGVTVWLAGNSAPEAYYYLRFRVQSDSTPPRKLDSTRRILVRQQ
jgi:hypothetical protein